MNTIKSRALSAAVLGALCTTYAFAQANNPNASTSPLRYESAFADYQPLQEAALLPWKDLFTESGEFAVTSVKIVATESPVRKTNPEMKVDTPPPAPAQINSASTPASDTRGRIESINAAEGKVKLKHGPIPKFDMPGMTMVFRVADPTLLTKIKAGDEVGVTLDKSGSGFVITGFQK